jgi:two-component system chemotaxis response regulator CheY
VVVLEEAFVSKELNWIVASHEVSLHGTQPAFISIKAIYGTVMATGVLVVDDSDYMRAHVTSALGDEFEVVAEAKNGAEAVQEFKRHQSETGLVMMDIVMREANGVKAAAAITELDPGTKIIMCTSVGQKKKMKLAAKAGADGYIIKPFDETDVADAVADVYGEQKRIQ